MVLLWDDGELASPRGGESNRRALSIKVPPRLPFFARYEICFHNLGVVRVDFNIPFSIAELK